MSSRGTSGGETDDDDCSGNLSGGNGCFGDTSVFADVGRDGAGLRCGAERGRGDIGGKPIFSIRGDGSGDEEAISLICVRSSLGESGSDVGGGKVTDVGVSFRADPGGRDVGLLDVLSDNDGI